jgi:pilus assembly protein FimV
MLAKRPLLIAWAPLLTCLAGTAEALGLGAMRTQSALNQPFYAEIELNDVRSKEIDAVKARLASSAEFTKAGAERPNFLTRLQFTPAVGVDGRPHIQVSSREPIREPYIDFLVEVVWPEGRLVKEYTVLLDPPARGAAGAPRVAVSTTQTARRRPPPEPAPPPLRGSIQPEQQAAQQRAPQRAAPQPPPAAVPPEAEGIRFPLHYGPVQRGATLSGIARAMTPPGATVEQTAMALFRNNQDAFLRGDANMLRMGVDLVVPTAEELFALDQSAARREYEAAMAGRSVNTGPIIAVASDARLRIPASGGGAGQSPRPMPGPAMPPDPALRAELLNVQADAQSNRQEAMELRNRVSELEGQLRDIQRLLELRDEQLAQLHRSERAGDVLKAGALSIPATPVGTRERAAASMDDSGRAETVVPSAAADRAPPESTNAVGISSEESDAGMQEPVPAPMTAVADVAAAEKPFWSSALATVQGAASAVSPWGFAAGAGTIVLGGLGLVAVRRRRMLAAETAAGSAGDDAVFAAPTPQTGEAEVEPPGGAVAAAPAADELQAYTLTDLDSEAPLQCPHAGLHEGPAIDTYTGLHQGTISSLPDGEPEMQEADVVGEADILLLYGRYREAEVLLREELDRSPARPDLRYKLGEALLGAGNHAALSELLEQMRVAGDDIRDAAKWASLEGGLAGPPASGADGDVSTAGGEGAVPGLRLDPLDDMPVPVGSDRHLLDGTEEGVDLLGNSEDTPPPSPSAAAWGDDPLELNLSDLEQLTQSPPQPPLESTPEAERATGTADHDSSLGDALSSQWPVDAGLWDEITTKLDLARAYIEMEDTDAARPLLEEVVQEGSAQQQAEAQAMLARIG